MGSAQRGKLLFRFLSWPMKKSETEITLERIDASEMIYAWLMSWIKRNYRTVEHVLDQVQTGESLAFSYRRQHGETHQMVVMAQLCKLLVFGGGNEDFFRYLVHRGADVNTVGGRSGRCLQAFYGSSDYHGDLVAYLTGEGADIDANCGECGTALQTACKNFANDLDKMTILLEVGAGPNILGGDYGSALYAVCYYGTIEMISMLLKYHPKVNLNVSPFRTLLDIVVDHFRSTLIVGAT